MYEIIKSILENENLKAHERYVKLYRECLSENSQENYLVFKEIIEVSDRIRLAEDETEASDPLIRKLTNQYYVLLRELVNAIAKKNLIPEEFYERLFKSIFESSIFPDRESEKGILLYLLAQRINSLPYYQAKDPIVLEEEKFRDIIKEIKPQLDMALYMIRERFDSYTEAASQLTDIADSLKSREKKAVFWTCVMQRYNKDNADE